MSEITQATNPAFAIGSTVRVVNDGETCSTYHLMAEHLGLTGWKMHKTPTEDEIYTVVGCALHERADEGEIIGIEQDGLQYLIGAAGLRLITAPVVSLADQVAKMEEELKTVTAERDALLDKLNNILSIVEGV